MSTSFESTDIAKAIIYIGFWFWQWSMTGSKSRQWYERYRQRIPLSPPGWLFGVMWSILFALLGVSSYIYARNYGGTAILWLILGNALANKLWSLLFFDAGQVLGALLVLLFILIPTAILIPILMATLDAAWVTFALWLPYPIWLFVALYLNWNWLRRGFPTNDDKLDPEISHRIQEKAARAHSMRNTVVVTFDDDDTDENV